MLFLIYILAFGMFVDCLLLILLVLMQLPKKEAGAGLAFGGAATDALFGAGSGNFLTKATKYSASAFFALALVLSVLQSRYYHRAGSEFRLNLDKAPRPTAIAPAPAASAAPAPAASPSTNLLMMLPQATNSPTPAP